MAFGMPCFSPAVPSGQAVRSMDRSKRPALSVASGLARPGSLQRKPALRFAGSLDVQSLLQQAKFPTVLSDLPVFEPTNPESVKTYQSILALAQKLARPEVSKMPVGAIAIGNSGKAYLGANLELKGGLPNDTVHAEVFALLNARANGESGIQMMIQSLRPCGSCRQALLETGNPDLPIHVVDMKRGEVDTKTAGAYLPNSYHYASGQKNWFQSPRLDISEPADARFQPAWRAALQSYLPNPNRKTWAGLSVQTSDKKQFEGCVLTVPAPNNTISPLQDVMVRMAAAHEPVERIQSVTMVEPAAPDYSFSALIAQVLRRVAPQATFSVLSQS